MKTFAILAVAQTQVLNNESCKSVKWEKEKVQFKVDNDGQIFAGDPMRRYTERNNELR